MMKVTHQYDDNTGRYMQVVPPDVLRRILDEQGSDYSTPDHFGPDDEWDVGEDRRRAHERRARQARLILEGNRVRLDGERFGTVRVILPSGRVQVEFDDGHTEHIEGERLEVER